MAASTSADPPASPQRLSARPFVLSEQSTNSSSRHKGGAASPPRRPPGGRRSSSNDAAENCPPRDARDCHVPSSHRDGGCRSQSSERSAPPTKRPRPSPATSTGGVNEQYYPLPPLDATPSKHRVYSDDENKVAPLIFAAMAETVGMDATAGVDRLQQLLAQNDVSLRANEQKADVDATAVAAKNVDDAIIPRGGVSVGPSAAVATAAAATAKNAVAEENAALSTALPVAPERNFARIVRDKQARTQDDIGRGGLAPTEAKGGRRLPHDHANDTSEVVADVAEGKRQIPKGVTAMLQIDKDATAGGVVTQDEYAVVRCICDFLSNCTATDFKMPVLVSDEGPRTFPRGNDFRQDSSPGTMKYLELARDTWLASFADNLKGEGRQSNASEMNRIIFGASSHTGIGVSIYSRDLDKLSVICDDNTLSEQPIILHKYTDGDRECINLRWNPDKRYFDFARYFWSRDINPSGWEPSLERRAGVRTLLEDTHFLATDHMSGIPGFVPKHILTASPALEITVGALPPTFVDMTLRPKFDVKHIPSSDLLRVKDEASSKLDGTQRGGYARGYQKPWPEVYSDFCTALRDSNLDASVRRFMVATLEQYADDAPAILSLLYGGMSYKQSVDKRLDPKGRKGFEQKFLTAVGGPTLETIIFNSQSKRQSDVLEAFACGLLECGTRRNMPSFVFLSRGLGGLNVIGGGLPVWQRFSYCAMKTIVKFFMENSAELGDELVMSSHHIVTPVRMYLSTVQIACLEYLQTRDEYKHMAEVEQVTLSALHSYTGHLGYEANVSRIARAFGIEDRVDAKRLLHQKLREIQVYYYMAENDISSFDEASSLMQRDRTLSSLYDMDELEQLKEDILLTLANAEAEDDTIQSKVEALVAYHTTISMDEVTVSLGSGHRIEFLQASMDTRRVFSQDWADNSNFAAVISSPDAVWRIEHEMRALLDVLGDDGSFKSKPAPFVRRVLQFILNRGRGQDIRDVVEDYAGNVGNDLEARLVQALEDAGERIDVSLNERRKDSVKIEALKDVLRSVRSPLEFADVVTIFDAVYQNAEKDARITLASSFGANSGMCITVKPGIAKDQVMLEAQTVLRVFERDDCFAGRTIAFVRDALKMALNVKSAVREAVLEENVISRAELALTAEQAKIAHDALLKRYKDDGLSCISIYKYRGADNRIIIQKKCPHFGTKFNLMLDGNSVVEAATGADYLTRVHALCADKTKQQKRQLLEQLNRSPPDWVDLTETSIPTDTIKAARLASKTPKTKNPFNYLNPSEISAQRAAEIDERGLDLQREFTTEKKVEIFRAVVAKIGVIL